MSYIDPVTNLPQGFGELFSDRNIMIVGNARWTPGALPTDPGTIDVDPSTGLKIITTPLNGGAAAVTLIPGGTSISLTWDGTAQRGSSVWVELNRLAGTKTETVGSGITVYSGTTMPVPSSSTTLLCYRSSASDVVAASFLIAPGPVYTKMGAGTGYGQTFTFTATNQLQAGSTNYICTNMLGDIPYAIEAVQLFANGWVPVPLIDSVWVTNDGSKYLRGSLDAFVPSVTNPIRITVR